MPEKKTFKDLVVWQKSRDLTQDIYKLFGRHADYGFRDQICRASVSVMSNIAEGYKRGSDRDFTRFLYIAKGSLAEVTSLLILAADIDYIDQTTFIVWDQRLTEISKMLGGLIKTTSSPSAIGAKL